MYVPIKCTYMNQIKYLYDSAKYVIIKILLLIYCTMEIYYMDMIWI